jgi:hypothetical protein
MRSTPTALALLAALTLVSGHATTLQPKQTTVVVRGWSDPAGPYGVMWMLVLEADGAASVTRWPGPGEGGQERQFRVAPEDRVAIAKAVEDAPFFELPEYIGPQTIPLHGPENRLHVDVDGWLRKVRLHDPANQRGARAERFKRVWAAVIRLSPIKPPF